MSSPVFTQQALNKGMVEAVEFVHAEGWDASPTLFALVPTALIAEHIELDDESPLTLVVQDNLPDTIEPGSEELADYVSRVAWPREVAGVVLAQEIMFRDTSAEDPSPRPARLFSGCLREEGIEQTLLQLRPTEQELADAGLFAHDDIQLRGGSQVAPGVIAALRYGLSLDPDELY
ncbi:MAG: PPA1309 family protein [Corynebacterium sp.]|nr:PPA1309 family protein [Corynebacterium sp.]